MAEYTDRNWLDEIPNSLRLPWELAGGTLLTMMRLANILEQHAQREDPDANTADAEEFATNAVHLRDVVDELDKALELVRDEFAAVANGAVELLGCYHWSAHEAVFSFGDRWAEVWLAIAPTICSGFNDLPVSEMAKIEIAESDIAEHFEYASKAFAKRPCRIESQQRLDCELAQEVCRAYDRRLVTKRSYPIDEEKGELPPWDEATLARNKWIYETACNGVAYTKMILQMKTHEDWEAIFTTPGLTRAGNAYARFKGLPEIPGRKPGRPRKTKRG